MGRRSLIRLSLAAVLAGLAGAAGTALASGRTFLVLGVIASANQEKGVALLKAVQGGEAFAARVGQELAPGVSIKEITRDYVFLDVHGHTESVKVGEQLDTAAAPSPVPVSGGIERVGNTVRLTAALRDQVVKRQLSQVMMQAAAVPYYVNGELVGFTLRDIDKGSLYDQAGFRDGDVVTAIDGQRLSDVGRAIRVLQSLRDAEKAEVTFLRGGVEQSVEIVVQ